MPNTIADNLQRLVDAKADIASAITAKGGTVNTGDGFEEFAADIATVPSGGLNISATPAAFKMSKNIVGKVVVPDGVTSISANAFNQYSGVTEITIPSSVTSIGSLAFGDCTALTTITINKPSGSISGAPWGAPSTTQVVWTG